MLSFKNYQIKKNRYLNYSKSCDISAYFVLETRPDKLKLNPSEYT